jgi:hypothetical protein
VNAIISIVVYSRALPASRMRMLPRRRELLVCHVPSLDDATLSVMRWSNCSVEIAQNGPAASSAFSLRCSLVTEDAALSPSKRRPELVVPLHEGSFVELANARKLGRMFVFLLHSAAEGTVFVQSDTAEHLMRWRDGLGLFGEGDTVPDAAARVSIDRATRTAAKMHHIDCAPSPPPPHLPRRITSQTPLTQRVATPKALAATRAAAATPPRSASPVPAEEAALERVDQPNTSGQQAVPLTPNSPGLAEPVLQRVDTAVGCIAVHVAGLGAAGASASSPMGPFSIPKRAAARAPHTAQSLAAAFNSVAPTSAGGAAAAAAAAAAPPTPPTAAAAKVAPPSSAARKRKRAAELAAREAVAKKKRAASAAKARAAREKAAAASAAAAAKRQRAAASKKKKLLQQEEAARVAAAASAAKRKRTAAAAAAQKQAGGAAAAAAAQRRVALATVAEREATAVSAAAAAAAAAAAVKQSAAAQRSASKREQAREQRPAAPRTLAAASPATTAGAPSRSGRNASAGRGRRTAKASPATPASAAIRECSFMYRYILRESCLQFDSLPLTSF